MCYFSWKAAIPAMVAALVSFAYYRWRSYRELGGITGDTAGYFLSVCECAMVLAAAVASLR
jgi:adenosylcobinamide-GDP ribazoletransferase